MLNEKMLTDIYNAHKERQVKKNAQKKLARKLTELRKEEREFKNSLLENVWSLPI